jgi:hypothetical protein
MLITSRKWCGSIAERAFFRGPRRLPILLLLLLLGTATQLASWPAGSAVENAALIPAGTVLPIHLDKPISVKEAQPGHTIEASVMQDVPLPDGEKISMKAKVMGSIVSSQKDADGQGVSLTFKFTQLEEKKGKLTIVTYLRAVAGFLAVRSAQMPNTGADSGSPSGWATTILVGGDVRFGDGGAVRHGKETVGKGVVGGVLGQIIANPALGCEGGDGANAPQALWVFSSNACGVYGIKGVKIAHAGKGEPIGEITLHFAKDDMKLEPGTGMLLRIASKS